MPRKDKPLLRPGTVCWSCKHFSFSTGDSGYSEYTPGYDASMRCAKDVWNFSFTNGGSQEDLEKSLKTAETCTKFEPRRSDDSREEKK